VVEWSGHKESLGSIHRRNHLQMLTWWSDAVPRSRLSHALDYWRAQSIDRLRYLGSGTLLRIRRKPRGRVMGRG
jgi:hypothetical protein